MATQTRNPTSDEAVSGSWTGSAGTRYTLVDDHPDTAGTDFLAHGTTAGNITFGYSAFSVPAGATSISVDVLYYDAEPSNGANNSAGRLKVGGNYYVSATHNPAGTTYTLRTKTWATNPKSATAWTVDDVNGVGVNALQAFGLNSTDANPVWRCSSIQLQVTYTPPAVTLAATSAGVSTVASSLAATRPLAATSVGVSTLSGALAVSRPLAATSAGTGTVSAALTVVGIQTFAALSAGVSTVSAGLALTRGLVATSGAGSTVAAQLAVAQSLAATVVGQAGVVPALKVQGQGGASTGGYAGGWAMRGN